MALRVTQTPESGPATLQPAPWWHEHKVTCAHCRRSYQLQPADEVDIFGYNALYVAGRFRCRHCETWNSLDRPRT